MRSYTFWLKTSAVMQFITAAFHSISFFAPMEGSNPTEKQLVDLMCHYKLDFGAGFHPTMYQLFTSLSACFPLLCLLSGIVNWYLLLKRVEPGVIRGIININILIFAVCFCVMAALAFLVPIISVGLVLVTLVAARLTIRSDS